MKNTSFFSIAIIFLCTTASVGAFAGSGHNHDDMGYSAPSSDKNSSEQVQGTQSKGKQFLSIDQDKNGFVDQDEFTSLDSKKDFDQVDTDQNGQISRQEMDKASQ